MKELEEILKKISKPQVRVTEFQNNLRRSLLDSARFASTDGFNYRTAFCLSTTVAVVCAVVLIAFVFQPALSQKFHYALLSNTKSDMPGNVWPPSVGDQRPKPPYAYARERNAGE